MFWLLSIVLALVFSDGLFATVHTEKTFLLSQPIRLPSQYLFYDYSQESFNRDESLLGGSFQVTSFFRRDFGEKATGQYFGRNGSNCIPVGSGKTDFQAANLVYSNDPDSLKLSGNMSIAPYRIIRGLHFSYMEQLSWLSDRVFLNIHVPLIHISRYHQFFVCDDQREIIDGKKMGVANYFLGNLEQKKDPTKQETLNFGRYNPCKPAEIMKFGDTECLLSYHFGNQKDYIRCVGGVVIPTSNKPKGKEVYEPLTGNGKRWGVKMGADASVALYETKDSTFKMTGGAYFTYLFPNIQKRMLSFYSDDLDSKRTWSHYYGLLGEHGKRGVFPAANVLTRDVRVTNGWTFDGFLDCSLHIPSMIFSVGYNFFCRGSEKVFVKHWDANKYALASPLYDTTNPFMIVKDPDLLTSDNLEGPITSKMLDTSVAQASATMTHKVYAMVSGVWDTLAMPLTVGVGLGYEFVTDNSVLPGTELYVRVGTSF